jgi:tetratricopeptide (TPR) repeat protein
LAALSTALLAGVDDLPIVVRDLPDESNRTAVADYERATVLNPEPLVAMFSDSWEGLVLPSGDDAGAEAVHELGTRVADHPEESKEGIDPDVAREAMETLAVDSRNADRLNNAAVALWLYGVTHDIDPVTQKVAVGYAEYVQQAAVHLLEITNEGFPGNRAVLLNLAFLRGVVPVNPDRDFGGAVFARQVLDGDAADLTARLLLASLQSRKADDPDGVAGAEDTLEPLLTDADPARAALGHSALGDAQLAAATIRRPESPADSRRHARMALAEYETAIAAAPDDPGLHAGRALALEALDEIEGAIDAQQTAVRLAPESIDLLVGLARLEELNGDIDGLRSSADTALELPRRGWDPSIAGLRFVTDPYGFAVRGDYGFLGWSAGSERDHLPVKQTPQGGGVVIVSSIARTNEPELDHGLRALVAPWAAARLALHGAIDEGRRNEAATLPVLWDRTLPWSSAWMNDFIDAAGFVGSGQLATADPSDLTASQRVIETAETSLRRGGRYDRAAELCRGLAVSSTDAAVQAQAWRCAGENTFLSGQPVATAAEDLINGLQASLGIGAGLPGGGRGDPVLRLLAGDTTSAAGDGIRAERLLRQAVADDSSTESPVQLVAALHLGDFELAAGEPVAAAGDYALALAMIDVNRLDQPADYWDTTRVLEIRALGQVATNNRAIALLQSLQLATDGAPDCGGEEKQARCEEALAGFQDAAASDPGNAVYRLNVGWADRLLGDVDGAREALSAAVNLDPTLFPAFNDLGVLLAEREDIAGARSAFEAALAASPDYELARWNLGILRLRESPPDVLGGQAALARAITTNHDLARAPLDFRLDERTYQFGFDVPSQAPIGEVVGRGQAVGAAVLAGAATVATLAQLQAAVFSRAIGNASVSALGWFGDLSGRVGWRARVRRLRRRLGRSSVSGPLAAVLPWLLTAAVLILVTAWEAAQANPVVVPGAVVLALLAVAVGVLAHEVGHLVAARGLGGRLIPAQWGPGAAVALVFLPFQAAAGPYFAERVRLPSARASDGSPPSRAWIFHFAGPLANAVLAVGAYLLFQAEPWPFLRLLSQVQLALIAYSLLPIRPLDGFELARTQPRLLAVAGLALFAASAAFALGLL